MTNKEAKDLLTHYVCCCPYGTSPVDCNDKECKFGMAIRTLCDNARPKGKWNVISLLRDYVYVRCSECGQGTRLVRDSKNEFCCIKDVRTKIISCPYCGADMRGEENGR